MPPDSNSRVLSGFLDYLRVERGLAKLTIAAYTSDLGQFAEFLRKRNRLLGSAQREDVRDFIQHLFSNGVDGRSVGRKLSAIRQLARYLLLDGKIDKDPTLNITSPKQWKVLPKALSRGEVDAMLVPVPTDKATSVAANTLCGVPAESCPTKPRSVTRANSSANATSSRHAAHASSTPA